MSSCIAACNAVDVELSLRPIWPRSPTIYKLVSYHGNVRISLVCWLSVMFVWPCVIKMFVTSYE